MAITINPDVLGRWNSIYSQKTEASMDFLESFYQPSVTEAVFGPIVKTRNKTVSKTRVQVTERIQAFQCEFTPDGNLVKDNYVYDLCHLKADNDICPDDLVEEYDSFLEGPKNDRRSWPFNRWYATHRQAALVEDWECRVVYKGEKSDVPVPGTAHFDGFQGFGVTVNLLVDAGDIITIPLLPSLDPVTFVDQIIEFEKVWVAGDKSRRIMKDKGQFNSIEMSTELRDRFMLGIEEKFNKSGVVKWNLDYKTSAEDQQNRLCIPYTNTQVIGLPSMIGSDKIVMTPQWNKWSAARFLERANMPQVGAKDGGRELWYSQDWWRGLGYWSAQFIATNDQDLAFGVAP